MKDWIVSQRVRQVSRISLCTADWRRGKNVTFFMQDELDEYSINLEMWNMALGELEKQNRKTIKEALNNLIKQ